MDGDSSEEIQSCIDLRIRIAEFRRPNLSEKQKAAIAADERQVISSIDQKPRPFYLL